MNKKFVIKNYKLVWSQTVYESAEGWERGRAISNK